MRNQCTKLCRCTWTPCMQHSQQDALKLEDWFMGIETATGMLTESCSHLVEAMSHGLTHALICDVTQIGKCWDKIKGILRLKLCNPNIYTYTSHFIEVQQKDNETLCAYIHHFKTAAKGCAFDNDTVAIHIFVKGLWDSNTTTDKIYIKRPSNFG